MAEAPHWAPLYLEPFEHLLARFFIATGAVPIIVAAVEREFPTDDLPRELDAHLDAVEDPGSAILIPLFLALLGNLDAISRFSCTMNDLIVRSADRRCVVSLARAASIDSGVLALPAAQIVMKVFQLTGDDQGISQFLHVVGQGAHKARQPYQELRWVEYLLREQGAFSSCSHEALYDLIVNGLGIYGADSEHKDSKRALFALFRKWRVELAN